MADPIVCTFIVRDCNIELTDDGFVKREVLNLSAWPDGTINFGQIRLSLIDPREFRKLAPGAKIKVTFQEVDLTEPS